MPNLSWLVHIGKIIIVHQERQYVLTAEFMPISHFKITLFSLQSASLRGEKKEAMRNDKHILVLVLHITN